MKKKVLIVTASYYWDITGDLRAEAEFLLEDAKIKFDVIDVPGVFEIPVTIAKNIRKYDGFIALGCVIKGETPHFEIISQSISDKVLETSLNKNVPIIFGVLTTNNESEAEERAAYKGSEFAMSALSILDTLKKIK